MNDNKKHTDTGKDKPMELEDRSFRIISALMDDELSEELRHGMQEWYNSGDSDPEKYEAFLRYSENITPYAGEPDKEQRQRYDALAKRLGLPPSSAPEVEKMIGDKRNDGLRRRRIKPWQVAAVLIPFFAIVSTFFLFNNKGAESQQVPQIAGVINSSVEGVQKEVVLKDQTAVWLNSSSTLSSMENTGETREVHLAGEAIFHVARDERKPFVVHTDHLMVRVLGTKFNLTAYPDAGTSEVILYEGSVEVSAGKMRETMSPGQKLTYYHDVDEFLVEQITDMNDWRLDVLFFRDRTLDELFRLIANYYNVEIVFTPGAMPAGELYAISIGKDFNIEQVIRTLSISSGKFDYTVNGDVIEIKER